MNIGVATILFVAGAIFTGWEAFRSCSPGWGGFCLTNIGLAVTTM